MIFRGDRAFGINTHVITSFDLWLQKDERQRILWPSTVCLSKEYFESLQKHAVPLNESDLAALAHTAMGIELDDTGMTARVSPPPVGKRMIVVSGSPKI